MSSDATSQPPPLTLAVPPLSSSSTSLAPGFRFHPTDEELVSYYLKRKISNRPLRVDAISELDIYKSEPWDLPVKSRIRSRDMEWYFFSPLDRKYSNRSRTSRTTGVGYWKTTGKDRAVKRGAKIVGMKKTLVFHLGKAPKGTRTNWVMHEYRLVEASDAGRSQEAEYVVCRIFQKIGAGPQNGAHYGAPFVEEEWEDEDNSGLMVPNEDASDRSLVDFGDNLLISLDDFNDENKTVDIQKDPLPLGCSDGCPFQVTTIGSANFSSVGNNCKDHESSIEISELDNNNNSIGFSDVQLPENEILQNQEIPQEDYLELNDFTNFLNVELFSGEDIDITGDNKESNSYQGCIDQLSELINIEEFSGNCNIVDSSELGHMKMPSVVDDNSQPQDTFYSFVGDYSSHNQADDEMMYFDAPSNNPVPEHDDWMNNFLYTAIPKPSSPDLVDELMTYFDATEDDLLYSADDREIFAPEVVAPQTFRKANTLEFFGGHLDSKRENNPVPPDGHSGNSWNKKLKNRLVGMLDSISSPPALAAEYPAKALESLRLNSRSPSSRSIHLPAGVIYMDSWDKFPPYVPSKDAASDSVQTCGKKEEHCGIISTLIRSGFCVSFLSILFLGVSYGLGLFVCSSSR